MARDMVPVLKRCRSLGLDPIYLGVDKNLIDSLLEEIEKRASMDSSLLKNRKQSSSMAFLKNLSETILQKPAR